MKHRKRSRLQFQPSFLVGALSALSLSATACGALVTDGPEADSNDASSDGTGGTDALDGEGPATPGCPEVTPAGGTACTTEQDGLWCGTSSPCDSDPWVTCSNLVWHDHSTSCNPPPPDHFSCPEYAPPIGSACSEPGFTCREGMCSGDPGIVCGVQGTWQETFLACNPPPIGYGGADALGGASGAP